MTEPSPNPQPASTTDTTAVLQEDTIAYHSPVAQSTLGTPSWQRWWRQVKFVPMLHNKWLTPDSQLRLNQAVRDAEQGHRGEVVLVIENHLPLAIARTHNCRDRAIQVFADYRVWDTSENTGVLVYLNVCEQRIEIVADRGINAQVMPSVWQAICDKALEGFKSQRQVDSLVNLLADIGQLLRQHYYLEHDPNGNELRDEMIYLR